MFYFYDFLIKIRYFERQNAWQWLRRCWQTKMIWCNLISTWMRFGCKFDSLDNLENFYQCCATLIMSQSVANPRWGKRAGTVVLIFKKKVGNMSPSALAISLNAETTLYKLKKALKMCYIFSKLGWGTAIEWTFWKGVHTLSSHAWFSEKGGLCHLPLLTPWIGAKM